MYNASLLATIYKRNYNAIQAYIKDISNEESRHNPPTGGSNLNWTFGLIVASRNYIMPALKQEAFWSETTAAPYIWGSEKLTDKHGLPLKTLLEQLETLPEIISNALESFLEDDLNAELSKATVGQCLEFFTWHEGYHTGQLVLLRQILGKDIVF